MVFEALAVPSARAAPGRRRVRCTRSSSPSTGTSPRSARSCRRLEQSRGRARRAARGRVRRRRLARRLALRAAPPAGRGDALLLAADRAVAQLRLVQRDPRRARRGAGRLRGDDGRRPAGAGLARARLLRRARRAARPTSRSACARRATTRCATRCRRARSGGSTAARRAGDPARRGRRVRLHAPGRRPAVRMDESHTSLSGCSTGSASAASRCRAAAAAVGERWSFRRKLRYLLDTIFSFTDLPIMLIIGLGALGVAVSSGVVGDRRGGVGDGVPGYTPLMLASLRHLDDPVSPRSSARTSGGRTRTARAARARSR